MIVEMNNDLMRSILLERGGKFIDSGLGYFHVERGALVFTVYTRDRFLIEYGIILNGKFEVIVSHIERGPTVAADYMDSLYAEYGLDSDSDRNWIKFKILKSGHVELVKSDVPS